MMRRRGYAPVGLTFIESEKQRKEEEERRKRQCTALVVVLWLATLLALGLVIWALVWNAQQSDRLTAEENARNAKDMILMDDVAALQSKDMILMDDISALQAKDMILMDDIANITSAIEALQGFDVFALEQFMIKMANITSLDEQIEILNNETVKLINGQEPDDLGEIVLTGDGIINIVTGPASNEITISAPAPTPVSLNSAGGANSLVNDGTGPTLATKGLDAGTGISITDSGTALTIASLITNPTLGSAGGTVSLVNDGTGPSLATKGLTAGMGISLTDNGDSVTIATSGAIAGVSSFAGRAGTFGPTVAGPFTGDVAIFEDPNGRIDLTAVMAGGGGNPDGVRIEIPDTLIQGSQGVIVDPSGGPFTIKSSAMLEDAVSGSATEVDYPENVWRNIPFNAVALNQLGGASNMFLGWRIPTTSAVYHVNVEVSVRVTDNDIRETLFLLGRCRSSSADCSMCTNMLLPVTTTTYFNQITSDLLRVYLQDTFSFSSINEVPGQYYCWFIQLTSKIDEPGADNFSFNVMSNLRATRVN